MESENNCSLTRISWDVTLTQFWNLQELVLQSGTTRSPAKLMAAAITVVKPNTIPANIKSMRKKFNGIDSELEGIKAEYGVAYRWLG